MADRELALQALQEVDRRASHTVSGLTTNQLLAYAGVRSTLSLVEPPPVDVALDEFLAGVDAEALERVALERFGDVPGSLTELMLARLRELAREQR